MSVSKERRQSLREGVETAESYGFTVPVHPGELRALLDERDRYRALLGDVLEDIGREREEAQAELRRDEAELAGLRQRAQRAEAALRDIARGPLQGPPNFDRYAQKVARGDLATPPPESEPDTCGLCGCSLVGAKFYPVVFLGIQVAVCPDCAEREGESTDEPRTPEQTANNLYACIAGGSPDESECVIVRGNSGIRSWVHQALFSGRWNEAPQDVRDMRESAIDPEEWEDDHWSARFEDGWLNIRPVTRIERGVHLTEPQQTGDALAYCFVDVDGNPSELCHPPECASYEDSRTILPLYTASGVPEISPAEIRKWAQGIIHREGTEAQATGSTLALAHRIAGEDDDSGVPYVPENIRNLPEKLDQDEQSLWRQGGQRERQMAEGMRRTIKQLRKALASAPAVPEDESDLVKRLTAAMREADRAFEDVGGSTRHHVRDCLLPILSKHGLHLIAAAPTDGRE